MKVIQQRGFSPIDIRLESAEEAAFMHAIFRQSDIAEMAGVYGLDAGLIRDRLNDYCKHEAFVDLRLRLNDRYGSTAK